MHWYFHCFQKKQSKHKKPAQELYLSSVISYTQEKQSRFSESSDSNIKALVANGVSENTKEINYCSITSYFGTVSKLMQGL